MDSSPLLRTGVRDPVQLSTNQVNAQCVSSIATENQTESSECIECLESAVSVCSALLQVKSAVEIVEEIAGSAGNDQSGKLHLQVSPCEEKISTPDAGGNHGVNYTVPLITSAQRNHGSGASSVPNSPMKRKLHDSSVLDDDAVLRNPKKAGIETSTSSVKANRRRLTDVLFQKFSHIRLSIELYEDVLGSEGGAASFAERWPNIDLGELNLAQAMKRPGLLAAHLLANPPPGCPAETWSELVADNFLHADGLQMYERWLCYDNRVRG